MFFESYELIWVPQRPARTKDAIEESLKGLPSERIIDFFTFEDRVAVRSLMYCVMDDVNLRNVLDGLILPPPYSLLDLAERRWTAEAVAGIVRVIDPVLDGLIVQLPFNLAMRLGSYDARLRAACRRLCWVLGVPFSVVEAREEMVAKLRLKLLEEVGPSFTDGQAPVADASARTDGGRTGGAALPAPEQGKREEIAARKERQKRSLQRIATVGGFAVLGGAALVLTGGLVAPLIAPAFGALVTATTVTLGAIGSVGTAVLGSTALAGIFTAIVGIGTHAAALASVLTPVLTAANVTAIFGVSGATLAGYKAIRRTGDSDTFVIRSVDEIETFVGSASAAEESGDANDPSVAGLGGGYQAIDEEEEEEMALLGTKLDLSSVVEDGSKPGLVVPSHTRTVGMMNVSNIRTIKKRNRYVVFGVESALKGYELRLKALKLTSGVWGMTPPASIPAGSTGLCASMNRYMSPTGTGFVLCYVAEPVSTGRASPAFRLWLRVDYDFLGGWELSSFCEGIEREFDPFKAEMRLETDPAEGDYTKTNIGVTMEMHFKPFTYVKVYPSADQTEHARKVTFPIEELPQRQLEYAHDVKQRRKVGVSFVNGSKHLLHITDLHMVNGVQWAETASPMVVEPRTASLTYFTNDRWSLEGAEGYFIVEINNKNETPIAAMYYVRLQFEISALNNLNVAVATAPTAREVRQMELTPSAPETRAFPVETKPGLFFALSLRLLEKESIVELRCDSAVERDTSVQVVEKASMTVGVCGYNGVFDARRPLQDQQVGLWQQVLRNAALLGPSEAYAVQWEDEYLTRFGETIKVDLQIADAVGKKAISKATSVAKKQLMQGVIFSGFRAFNTFLGSFELPLYAVWASDVIDNNYATLSNRAEFAGKDLAAALLEENRGSRPVSLVGFSFGSKVIAECLKELERVGAFGIVENAYLMGATFAADRDEWLQMRHVVAGRLVNVYTRSDWALWLMYKANEGALKPMAGITPVGVAGVENVDASAVVQQHSGYALRLAEVLDLIPQRPNTETWGEKSMRGSPGVIAPTTAYRRMVKTMSSSLDSMLSSNAFSVFAVRNGIVTDLDGFSPSLELVAMSTFNCFFDYLPPASVDPGCAGVFGVVGEDSSQAIGGTFSFRLRLNPFSSRDVLLLVPFYAEKNNDISVTARPSLVTQRSTRDETGDDADSRFYTIATGAITNLEDAEANTVGAAPARTILTPKAPSATVAFDVPLDNAFLDNHRDAAFKVCVSKVPGGVELHVLALLNRAASQLQQEGFTAEKYEKKYAKTAEAAAKAALGVNLVGDDGVDAKSDGGGTRAAGAKSPTVLPGTPSIADVESIDHFQSTLLGVAASLQGVSRASPTPAHGSAEGDDAAATAAVTSPIGKAPATLPDLTLIVLANCGQVPLYFAERPSVTASGPTARSPFPLQHCADGDITSTLPQEGASGAEALSTSTVPRKLAHWVRFPPPELPPQHFCVASITNFACGAFPGVRYETSDGVCCFDVKATAAIFDTPHSSFAGSTVTPVGGGPHARPSDGEEPERLIVCSVLSPLFSPAQTSFPSSSGASPSQDVGEVTTSTTVVRGARFHLVLLSPKVRAAGTSFSSRESEEAAVKKALKSYGWFIA